MTHSSIEELINMPTIISVITITDEKKAVDLARALKAGGLNVLEITLRTEQAINAATIMIDEFPELVIGLGTIATADDIKRAKDIGAKFIVSPGLTESLATVAADEGISFLPGCCTPTDVIRAKELGFKSVKFFPAGLSGGIKMLQQFASVFPEMKFCPTGGINEQNAIDYLKLKNVFCLGGSWLSPEKLINIADWEAIENISGKASKIVDSIA